MNNKQLALVTKQVEIILEEAQRLRGQNYKIYKENHVEYLYYLRTIDELITQLNKITPETNLLFKKEGIDYQADKLDIFNATLDEIRTKRVLFGADPQLLKIAFISSNILSFLRQDIVLPEYAKNKLESLTEEIKNLSTRIDADTYANLLEAKEEFEKSCFIGSSLISGRVIRACFDKIAGRDINEKIKSLTDLDLVRDKDGEPTIQKANHYGRNLASHDLKIMPTASESVAFLAEAVKLAKTTQDFIDSKKEKATVEPDKSAK